MNGSIIQIHQSFILLSISGSVSIESAKSLPGKGLFIPVMVVESSDKEIPNAPVEKLRSLIKDQDSVNSLYLKIGDTEYKYDNLTKYRTRTGGFDVVFPDNGIFGVMEGGVSKVVADGFYIITEPLAKGNYTIHFKSES